MRSTAEQNATECFSRWNVCVMIVTEISGRTAADCLWHNLATLSENDLFHIAFCTGFIANMRITLINAVVELCGVRANKDL